MVDKSHEAQSFLREKFGSDIEDALSDLVNLYVYIDGNFVRGRDAGVPVWDHGFLYGDGVFEGIRVHDGKIFRLAEHLDRLYDSAKTIGIVNIPLDKQELGEATKRTISINGLRDAHVRPIITRGYGKPGLDPRRSVRPSIIILAYPFPPLLGERPARLITSTVRRKSPHSVDAKAKSLNYLDNVLAKLQANAAGADDALMLDLDSFVAEATGENVFAVIKDVLHTPPALTSLAGITKSTVVELAASCGYRTVERNLTLGDLYTADEVFLTGTGAGLHAVAEIDGRTIGSGAPGPVTTRLKRTYDEYVRRKEHTVEVEYD